MGLPVHNLDEIEKSRLKVKVQLKVLVIMLLVEKEEIEAVKE